MKYKSFLTGIGIWVIVFIINKIYRPFIYINNINDFHIANSLSSIFYPMGILLPIHSFYSDKYSTSKLFKMSLFTCYGWELADVLFPPHHIDYIDLITLSIGSLVSYYLLFNNNKFRKLIELD